MSEQSEGSSERVNAVASNEDGLSTVLVLSLLEALASDDEFGDAVLTVLVLVASSHLCKLSLSFLPAAVRVLHNGDLDGDNLSLDLVIFCCLCLDDVEGRFGLIGVYVIL